MTRQPQSTKSINILVTSGRVPLALELSRALWQHGARVVIADSFPIHMCSHSRSVAARRRMTPPQADAKQFAADILEIVDDERIDVLVPVCEEALYLAEIWDRLDQVCTPLVAPIHVLEPLHNKWRFIEIAANLGFPVPETTIARTSEPVPVGPRTRTNGAVLKPVYSSGGREVGFTAAADGHVTVPAASRVRPWVIQEHIEGRDLCALAFVSDGRVEVSAVYRPTVTLGTNSVCFESAEHAQASKWMTTFARQHRHRGFVAFDFREALDGTLYPIECNPRITNGIHLMDAGAVASAILGPHPQAGVHRRAAPQKAMVGLGVLAAFAAARSPRAAMDILRGARRAREVTWAWRDPAPAIAQLAYNVRVMRLAKRFDLDLSAAVVRGLDWAGPSNTPPATPTATSGIDDGR